MARMEGAPQRSLGEEGCEGPPLSKPLTPEP